MPVWWVARVLRVVLVVLVMSLLVVLVVLVGVLREGLLGVREGAGVCCRGSWCDAVWAGGSCECVCVCVVVGEGDASTH